MEPTPLGGERDPAHFRIRFQLDTHSDIEELLL
jgi:hypothetical protein